MRLNHCIKVILCGFLLYGPTSALANNKPKVEAISEKDIQLFAVAMAQVQQHYVKKISYKKLFDNAIRGMLNGLDPHSDYLNAQDLQALKSMTEQNYGGIGIELMISDGFIQVVSPYDNTPAYKAGIKAGDFIVKVDGHLVRGRGLEKIAKKLRGKPGSRVKLTLIRKGVKKPIEVDLVRQRIRFHNVKSELIAPSIAYIRIRSFGSNLRQQVLNALYELEHQEDRPLKGLILDLRNNPGGLLDQAVNISDLFLSREKLAYQGMIVSTRGRIKANDLVFKAHHGDIMHEKPIVVLVNHGSASASEIVAGALQDHHRAIILGTKTFGKGSVQAVLPISHHAAIKLTTSLYYTPKGTAIQAVGVHPDVYVPYLVMPKDTQVDRVGHVLNEKSISGHLKTLTSEHAQDKKWLAQQRHMHLAYKDFQLYQALNLLQGLGSVAQFNQK